MSRPSGAEKLPFWRFTNVAGCVTYREESICMNTTLAVLGLSGSELMVIMIVALVLFGAKKIPEFAKGLGQAMKEFKKASSDVSNEIHNAMNQETPPPTSPPPAKPQAAPETAAPAATVPKS